MYNSPSISARPPPGLRSQEHPELAVLHSAGGAGVLPLHPGRLHALLQEPGLVGDQHSVRVAERRAISAQILADPGADQE